MPVHEASSGSAISAKIRTASSASSAKIIGNLDVANCSYFKGWILHQGYPGVSQYVTIDIDGTQYGPILADVDWPAIRDGNFPGHPYTQYGFLWSVPAQYNDGKIHNVNMISSATGEQLGYQFGYTANSFGLTNLVANANSPCEGQPINLSATAAATGEVISYKWLNPSGNTISTISTPQLNNAISSGNNLYTVVASRPSGCSATAQTQVQVTPSNFIGTVDEVNCSFISGWLVDANCQERSNNVWIIIDGQLVATVPADQVRNDVRSIILGRSSGYNQYGYHWIVPDQFRRGKHTVVVKNMFGTPLSNSENRRFGADFAIVPAVKVNTQPFAYGSTYTICEHSDLTFGLDRDPAQWIGSQRWSGPNGVQGPVVNRISDNWMVKAIPATQAGSYTYTVTDARGCINSAQVQFNVTPANYYGTLDDATCKIVYGWLVDFNCQDRPNRVQILIDGQVVDTIMTDQVRDDVRMIVLGRNSGYNQYGYRWVVPSRYQQGIHSIQVTDLRGKPFDHSVDGRTLSRPMATPNTRILDQPFHTPSVQTLCVGGNIAFGLNYWPPPLGYTQQWIDPNGNVGVINDNWDLRNITSAQSGYYTYKVTDATGCSDSSRVLVTVNPSPPQPILTARVVGTSTTQRITLTATGCPIGTEVHWIGPNSITATGANWMLPFTQTSTYQARCQVTNGCYGDAATLTAVYTAPSAPIIQTSATQLCAGDSVTLSASGCSTGVDVRWSSGQTGQSIRFAPTATAIYSASCAIGEVVGERSNQVQVSIANSLTVIGQTTYAVGETISLTAVSSVPGSVTYTWSGPAGFSQTGPLLQRIGAGSSYSGNYRIVAQATAGCAGQQTVPISVTGSPQVIMTQPLNLTAVCAGASLTVPFSTTGTFATSNLYTVQLSDAGGSFVTSTTLGTGTVSPLIAIVPAGMPSGVYQIRVVSNYPVTNGSSIPLTISGVPSLMISGKAAVCSGKSTTLTAGGGTNYVWSTGELGDHIVVSPTESTTYSVWSVGDNGCPAEAKKTVSATSFSVAANSNVGNYSSANQGLAAQSAFTTYGQTLTLSATVANEPAETMSYVWSGPNGFISNEQSPSFVYTSAAQLGTYEVTVSTPNGCASGARVSVRTEPVCDLIVSVFDKRNSSITTDERLLVPSGCDGGQLSWSNGAVGSVSNGKIIWADGEMGTIGTGLLGTTLTINPPHSTIYTVICALPSGKKCTNSVEVKVSSSDCPAFQISTSATTYEKGDVITLTATNCAGTVTWSNGLGHDNIVKIAPTSDLVVSAECADDARVCYSNVIAIENRSCIKSLYVSSIFLRGDGRKQVQFGYRGCETGVVAWTVVSGAWSSTLVQKQSEVLAGLYTVVGISDNLTVWANCTRTGDVSCPAATLTVTGNELNICKTYYIGIGTSVGAPSNTVTIDNPARAFTLTDETNFVFNTTPQKQVYVPVSMREKLYTATFENGCKSALKVFPTSIKTRLTWTEKAKINNGGYAGGIDIFNGGEKDSFVLNTYPNFDDESYEIDMTLQGYCPGVVRLTTSAPPAPGVSLPINPLVLRKPSYFSSPRPVSYQSFPTVTTDYYGVCQRQNTDGSVVNYPAVNSKRLVLVSNSCLQIAIAKPTVTKGESAQLNAMGCIGTLDWSVNGTSLGQGATLTHTPLPASTPSSVTYVATCSNPACSQTAVVTVNACSFSLTAAKMKAKIAEAIVLSSSGCSGGIVQWSTGETGSAITVKPLENTTYLATCLVDGASVCQNTVALTVDNTPPDDINCPLFQLTASTQTITRCSQQPVLITPSGCPVGSTITWSDGTISGPTAPHSYTLNDAMTLTATCTTPYQISVTQALSISAVAPKLEVSPASVYAGYPAVLRASGCVTNTCQEGQYSWYLKGNLIGTGASLKVTLAQATTYVVTCSNGSSKPVAVSLTQTCEVEYKTAAGIDGKSYLSIPDGCKVDYGVTWYKDDYEHGLTTVVATNVKKITVGLPPCDQYGTGGDFYHVICVKDNKVPCETRFSVFCNQGAYPVVAVSGSDPTTPDPCTDLAYIAKGGVKNIARSPGDESTGNYYVLYTDWCGGSVAWYDGSQKLSQLTVGPYTTAKSFTYECSLSSGQVCRGSYLLSPSSSHGGGRQLEATGAVSSHGSDNCSSQIALATAMQVFYEQLLCQVSNLIQTPDDAQAVLSSLQQQLSGTAVAFPPDLTSVINVLISNNCQQAAKLLAAANGSANIDKAVFNSTINSQFSKIQSRISALLGANLQVTGEAVQSDPRTIIVSVEASNQNEMDDTMEKIAQVDRRLSTDEDGQYEVNKLPESPNGQNYFREICTVWNMTNQPAYVDYLSNVFTLPAPIRDGISQLQAKLLVFPSLVQDGTLGNLNEDFLKDFFMKKIQGYENRALGLSSLYTGPNRSLYETVAAQLLNHFYGKSATDYFQTQGIADAIYNSTNVGNRRINNMIQIADALFFRKIGNMARAEDSNPNYYQKDFVPASIRSAKVLDDVWFKNECKSNVFPSFGASDAITVNSAPGVGDAERLGLFTIGGTPGIDVRVKSITPILTSTERGYQATIVIRYLDTFGVSEGDYDKDLGLANSLGQSNYLRFNYRGGVLSQWILQHQYGYRPFTDYLTYIVTMKRVWPAN